MAYLPPGTNLSVASIDELYEVVAGTGNKRQWPARYPNGDPAKARDGYTAEGTGVAPKTEPTIQALPSNVVICCDDGGGNVGTRTAVGGRAADGGNSSDSLCGNGRLIGGGTMKPFEKQFNFTVPCESIPTPLPAGERAQRSTKLKLLEGGGGMHRHAPFPAKTGSGQHRWEHPIDVPLSLSLSFGTNVAC